MLLAWSMQNAAITGRPQPDGGIAYEGTCERCGLGLFEVTAPLSVLAGDDVTRAAFFAEAARVIVEHDLQHRGFRGWR